MANAIHQLKRRRSLLQISADYYALVGRTGEIDAARAGRIVAAMRGSTPTDLSGWKESALLPVGLVLYVPTLRNIPRPVVSSREEVGKALRRRGFDHADKLLLRPLKRVLQLMQPLPQGVERADVVRSRLLTSLLVLDGMDRTTAFYLVDQAELKSLTELARMSPASLDTLLRELVESDAAPKELLAQGHAARWIAQARLLSRVAERSRMRLAQVPFHPSQAERRAQHYEQLETSPDLNLQEARLASLLARLHGFQQHLVQGNLELTAGRWSEARDAFQLARGEWHRLVEATGAAESVDDQLGVNLATAVETTRRLLLAIPGNDSEPLGAPPLEPRLSKRSGKYGLRAVVAGDLDRKKDRMGELRKALDATPAHNLPRTARVALDRAVNSVEVGSLAKINDDLLRDLQGAAPTVAGRDLERQERDLMRRNQSGTAAGDWLGVSDAPQFRAVEEALPLSGVADLVGSLWSDEPLVKLLSPRAAARYPQALFEREDVTAFTPFVSLPAATSQQDQVVLPVTDSFFQDYERAVLGPRLSSPAGEDLRFDDEVWADPGGFAAIAPLLYTMTIPAGLGTAYARLGAFEQANQYGTFRVNQYGPDGSVWLDVATADVRDFRVSDYDLFACSTEFEAGPSDWGTWESVGLGVTLEYYATERLHEADILYRQDRRDEAEVVYRDVMCAIENHWSLTGRAALRIDSEAGMASVYATIGQIREGELDEVTFRRPSHLSTMAGTQSDGSPVLQGYVTVTVDEPVPDSFEAQVEAASAWFDFHAPLESRLRTDIASVAVPAQLAGSRLTIGHASYWVDATLLDAYYDHYLYAQAKVQALASGLNWYGYPDEYVPPWSFDHLYRVAKELCDRALGAESQVFSLLSMHESAVEKELLAENAAELTWAESEVAELRVAQQEAANQVASTQADLSLAQVEAQTMKDAARGGVAFDTEYTLPPMEYDAATGEWAEVEPAPGALTGFPDGSELAKAGSQNFLGQALSGIPFIGASFGAAASMSMAHTDYRIDLALLEQTKLVVEATEALNDASLAVAEAERDVAKLRGQQAEEYLRFLQSKTLNSEALELLLGLAREVHEAYLHHAGRMAWLARRALEYQTRRNFTLPQLDYVSGDELADMTRAQRLTADLEAVRSEYVAGATERLQEVKWTIRLSSLDPGAWVDLRHTGICTFVIRQRWLDRHFPGTYLHRLRDARVEFIGLLPAEGPRGILRASGASWVRVPNDTMYRDGETADDWTTESLADSSTPYTDFIMKRLVAVPAVLTLSELDIRSDRAVLSSPQGMLKPLEHMGLDSAWTITLHRQANDFEFVNIRDMEVTFWFLCAYDEDLAEAQEDALIWDGQQGRLRNAAKHGFALQQPSAWAAFTRSPAHDGVDVRSLVWDAGGFPRWEDRRLLTNLTLAVARRPAGSDEITLRLCCDADPVGVELTTVEGAAFSLIGEDLSDMADPPQAHAALEGWVEDTFYVAGQPEVDPQMRWVVKAQPRPIGEAWREVDDEGTRTRSSSGALKGSQGALTRYQGGENWTNLVLQANVTHRKGTLRLCLRDDGHAHYACEIAPDSVRLMRVEDAETELARRDLAYPPEEFLTVAFGVVGDELTLTIDGISIFEKVVDSTPRGALTQGTVALKVLDSPRGYVEFDDLRVIRLTQSGVTAETLLEQPFTTELPGDWSFSDGVEPWLVEPRGYRRLDVSDLLNVTLTIDYLYQMRTV
ncbi:MAG: hypothetical protein ACE5JX_04910 [Acidobacteriota bacterium]